MLCFMSPLYCISMETLVKKYKFPVNRKLDFYKYWSTLLKVTNAIHVYITTARSSIHTGTIISHVLSKPTLGVCVKILYVRHKNRSFFRFLYVWIIYYIVCTRIHISNTWQSKSKRYPLCPKPICMLANSTKLTESSLAY